MDSSIISRMASALETNVVEVTPTGDTMENLKTSIKSFDILCEGPCEDSTYTKSIVQKEVDIMKKTYRSDEHRRMSQHSFLVEARAYTHILPALNDLRPPIGSPVAFDIQVLDNNNHFCFLLQDMQAGDSKHRHQHLALGMQETETAVRWLAALHAHHWDSGSWSDHQLWEHGGYWTLDKRTADLDNLERDWDVVVANWRGAYPEVFADPKVRQLGARLRQAGPRLSRALAQRWPTHRTLIHGDFKTANLFFNAGAGAVVALDWQWCGGGLGAMDLQYLLHTSSSLQVLHERERFVHCYHQSLLHHLAALGLSEAAAPSLEEFKEQFEVATLDYGRFLLGSMWRKNTPDACAAAVGSINQGMHKRCSETFVWLVQTFATSLEELSLLNETDDEHCPTDTHTSKMKSTE